uniref:Putative galacturonosyltransferase 3 isoform X1 n=1 Tax=Rhizophora mucronata TaxID=61149 RepID=A0A2P2NS86_RHIMU
MLNHLRFYLP